MRDSGRQKISVGYAKILNRKENLKSVTFVANQVVKNAFKL